MANSILSIFGMEVAPYGTPTYSSLRGLGRGIMHLQRGLFPFGMINFQPWLRYIFPKTVGYADLFASNEIIHPFIKVGKKAIYSV